MSFIAPSFIAIGAALAAIPIIIHFLNRRRFKIVEWAAMKYLLDAMRSNRRRLRFESLLLLIARCLALFLLALAIARPLGCADSSLAALAGARVGLHVVVIDDSYSMSYEAGRPDAATHFERAKRVARQLVERLNGGSQQVAVIAASMPARIVLRPTHDLDAAGAAIDRLSQSFAGTDLPNAFRLSSELAADADDAPTRSLHLLTDCTASALTIDPQLAVQAQAAVRDGRFRVALYQLGQSGQWNDAVTDLRTSDPLVRVGFGSDLIANVAGYGASGEAQVGWIVDGKPLPAGGAIKPTPEASPITQSQAAFDKPGPTIAEVTVVGDDRLKVDDVRRRVVDVVGDMKVLIVEGKRGMGALEGSGSFLRLALAPPVDPTAAQAGGAGRYVTSTAISDLELAGRPLSEYRAVILAGVGTVTPEVGTALRSFVEQGGSLLMFMGEAVNGDAYNATLGQAGLLPGAMVARVQAAAGGKGYGFAFDPAKPHPMLNAFRDVEKSGLESPGVYTYWRVQPDPARHAETVLSFTKDNPQSPADPAITVQSVGRGRVVFVATSADADWSLLVAKPAYVTLVHELLGGAVGGGEQWLNRTVGERIELPSNLTLTGTPLLYENDKLIQTLARADRGDGTAAWRSEPITRPGIYAVQAGEARWPVAVNVPGTEADIRTLEIAAVRRAMGDIELEPLGDTLPPVDEAAQREQNDLSWPILLALLPLLGIESLMAWRFSHGRGGAA